MLNKNVRPEQGTNVEKSAVPPQLGGLDKKIHRWCTRWKKPASLGSSTAIKVIAYTLYPDNGGNSGTGYWP